MNQMTREAAWALLTEYTKTPALQQHGRMVAAVMEHFATLYGGEPEVWEVAGLLHDIDYEMYPDQHCVKAVEIMTAHNVDPVYIRAMQCHGYGICTDVQPESDMEKVLYTIDELTGLINAACLMRPSKSVLDIEVKSVKKKFKDKKFAAGVDRDLIRQGAAMLGMELDQVIAETIEGMRKRAEEIGLKGNL